MVEHYLAKVEAVGSVPTIRSICPISSKGERHPYKLDTAERYRHRVPMRL